MVFLFILMPGIMKKVSQGEQLPCSGDLKKIITAETVDNKVIYQQFFFCFLVVFQSYIYRAAVPPG